MEQILQDALPAMTGWLPRVETDEHDINLNAQMLPKPCRNQHRHVSSFPGYGRELCPACQKYYIRK